MFLYSLTTRELLGKYIVTTDDSIMHLHSLLVYNMTCVVLLTARMLKLGSDSSVVTVLAYCTVLFLLESIISFINKLHVNPLSLITTYDKEDDAPGE